MASEAAAAAPPQQAFAQRPIRFITNDGKPYAKRRRINTACNTCRRRKTRCSGEKPFCETCKDSNQICAGYGGGGSLDHARTTSPMKDLTEYEGVKTSKDESTREGSQGSTSHSDSHENNSQQQPSPQVDPTLSQFTFEAAPTRATRTTTSSTADWNDLGPPRPSIADSGPSTTTFEESFATLSIRNRMPYFRYFGPTAIMPGFKQMVVKVQEKQRGGTANSSSLGERSPPALTASLSHDTASPRNEEAPVPFDPPVYDASDVPPNPLITHLCETFFAHLACNYPFLQKDRFMRDLAEKQVDPILVDAVCALAARFSTDPLLTGKSAHSKREVPPPERGQLFAQRAKCAIPDSFPCPSVAIVQAALLLAYDEFGANRDSGLWMYLGIAIRMAQDLGMQKLEGLRYVGKGSLTPQNITYMRNKRRRGEVKPAAAVVEPEVVIPDDEKTRELVAIERERVDTLWAVFHLDRYISSGTGRPVALRNEDIEIAFPALDELNPDTGWPKPWPALIRIVHLYGSVAEILNSIREVSHLTPDVIDRLTIMESNLTDIYQGLSPRLHFNAANFQHYVQNGQGTNFVMLHFWFHTLIMLLHQPTLLYTFDEEMQELFPRSRELSLSSAKTIADILAFTEIMSAESPLGNPFTSQPTYIAACAFLKESALHAMTSTSNSRAPSPPTSGSNDSASRDADRSRRASLKSGGGTLLDQQAQAKHTLLAASAKQNYQRCYRALEQLEQYWAGTKYILTILDQKATGVWDALLYTQEESESALEMPRPEPAFTAPGWRRKLSWGAYLGEKGRGVGDARAIGWSLTGTMNSPRNANLAVLYPGADSGHSSSKQKGEMYDTVGLSPDALNGFSIDSPFAANASAIAGDGVANSNMNPLLSYPFPIGSQHFNDPFHGTSSTANNNNSNETNQRQSFLQNGGPAPADVYSTPRHQDANAFGTPMSMDTGAMPYGNMMIESQNIDMSMLGGDDMMWLEYLPTEFGGEGFTDAAGTSGTGGSGSGGGTGGS